MTNTFHYSMPATLNTDKNGWKKNSSPSSSSLAPGLGTNTGSVGQQFSALHLSCCFVSTSNLITCTKISSCYPMWLLMINGIGFLIFSPLWLIQSSPQSGKHICASVRCSCNWFWELQCLFFFFFKNKSSKYYSTDIYELLNCHKTIKLPSLITSGRQNSFPSFSFTAFAVVYFSLTRFSPVSAHYRENVQKCIKALLYICLYWRKKGGTVIAWTFTVEFYRRFFKCEWS